MATASTTYWIWDEAGDNTWIYLAALALIIGALAAVGGWLVPVLVEVWAALRRLG